MSDLAGAHAEALFGPEFGHGQPIVRHRLAAALGALGAPEQRLPPLIHVAGTNGKGSTIAFLAAMLDAAGLRVGVFTKPHLHRLNERFRVAGDLISDAALIALAERLAATGVSLTQFEAHVAAAFLLFSETLLDAAILETGFGGRDDATNLAPRPRICVLTPIDLDHQAILGATRAEIAAHKIGIIKRGARIVSARQHPDILAVIEAAAADVAAPLDLCGRDWDAFAQRGRLIVQDASQIWDLPLPALLGPHQADNAGLAVRAALAFHDHRMAPDALELALKSTRWPGRFAPITRGALYQQVAAAGGELWVDGAHNPHAAAALARALAALPKRARTIALVAMLRRKDIANFLAELAPALDALIALPLEAADACSAEEIVQAAREIGLAAQTAPSVSAAIDAGLARGPARLIACGSLRLVALLLEPGVSD